MKKLSKRTKLILTLISLVLILSLGVGIAVCVERNERNDLRSGASRIAEICLTASGDFVVNASAVLSYHFIFDMCEKHCIFPLFHKLATGL